MSVMGGIITEDSLLSIFSQNKVSFHSRYHHCCSGAWSSRRCLLCLDVGDRFGSRGTVFVGLGFMIVGGALQASAWSLAQMIVCRLLSGIGLGLQVFTVPTWQRECCKPKSRRRWVMIENGLQTTGVACGQWIGYGKGARSSNTQRNLNLD